MSRVCDYSGKRPQVGKRVVRRGKAKREGGIGQNVTGISKRRWKPNLQRIRVVDENGRVSTLGRGGSDTSAVAVAAALKASLCDIYTDVDGVYTTDPRMEPKARRLPKVSFEEMLEMAAAGAKGP